MQPRVAQVGVLAILFFSFLGCQSVEAPRLAARAQSSVAVSDQEIEKVLADRIRRQTATAVPNGLDKPLSATKIVFPHYPREAIRLGRQGEVRVYFEVNENGDLENVKAIEGSDDVFARQVVDAVSQWKFEPPTLKGKPTRFRLIMPFNYGLR